MILIIIGGKKLSSQLSVISSKLPHVLIGTPSRICQILSNESEPIPLREFEVFLCKS